MLEIPRPLIGCSGWNYTSWRGPFYPMSLPSTRWLGYYTQHFDTVEINNTFYRLPERSTFEAWRNGMPSTFVAAVKASRFLTHMKRLRDPEEPLDRLLSRAAGLGRKLGPLLYQLPGHMAIDLVRLDDFLHALARRSRRTRLQHVMEFRHPSWYVPETFALLEKRGVALCLHDKSGSEITKPFVGPFVYVRFHGTHGNYHGSYSKRQLDAWARRLAEQHRDGRRIFAYFNNDPDAVAVANATTLRSALENLM